MIISLLLVAASAGCYNAGVVLQAAAARRSDASDALTPSLLVRLARAPSFVVGTALDASGWILQVLALTRASLTFVQPALGMGVFLLLAFAWVGLDERPSLTDIVGACSLAAGIALVAVEAPKQATAIHWPGAIAATTVLAIVTLAPYVLAQRHRPLALAVATGAAFSITGLTTEVVSRGLSEGASGLVALGLASSIAFGLLGFLAQTSALVSGRVTSVIPVVMVIDTAVPVVLAPLILAERWPVGALHISVLTAGLVLAIAGAAGLAMSPRVAVVRERGSGA